MKINKTNAARLLDKAKIAYELIPYEVDENDLSLFMWLIAWGRISSRYSKPLYCMVTRMVILFASFLANMKWT